MRFALFSVIFLLIGYIGSIYLFRFYKTSPSIHFDYMSLDICTICKGFSILIVMLSHTGNNFGIRYLTPLGSWGVGVFLFLSGYGLAVSFSNKGLTNYWKKRIVTAYLPYVFAEIFAYIFQPGSTYANLDLLKILLDLTLLRPLHPFGWYMQCLFIYYIAFYVAALLFPNKQNYRYILLFAVSVFVFVFFRSLFKQQFLCFALGVVLAGNLPRLQEKLTTCFSALLSFLLGAVALLLRQFPGIRDSHWIIYNGIFSLQVIFLSIGTICIFHWLSCRLPSWTLRPLSRAGLLSFELYLYHGFVYQWFEKYAMSYIRIVGFFLISFVIAEVVHNLKHFLTSSYWGKKRCKF